MVENACGKTIKVLRTDKGGEFCSHEFDRFCEAKAIKEELTIPYTLEQNVVVERKNRMVVEIAKSLLRECGFLNTFWSKARHN